MNQTKVLNLQFKEEEGKQNSKHTQDLLDDDKRYVLSGCFKEGIFAVSMIKQQQQLPFLYESQTKRTKKKK